MKGIIFAAGMGTRLKPWTDHHPKALAIVNGKSLLQRNVEYLQRYNVTDLIVNVHHFADQIIDTIYQHNGWGSQITISDERDALLETGGGLKKAAWFLQGNEPFVVMNADMLTNLNLSAMLAYHRQHHPIVTMGVTNRATERNFLFNNEHILCGWINTQTEERKISRPGQPLTPMAYSCVNIFEPALLPLIHQEGKFSVVDVYLDVARQHTILGYDHSGDTLVDVGKPESITKAEVLFP